MKQILILTATLLYGTTAIAQEAICTCTEPEQVWNFTTADPRDIDYMEEFPWAVVSCVGYQVTVNLVTEDSALLDSYFLDEDGNQKIYHDGQWVRFDQFKPTCGDDRNS